MRLASLGLVALLLLAGCSSPNQADEETSPAAFEELHLEATSPTGVIRGVVVDPAIRPLAGATITLRAEPPLTATTTDDGAFGFDGLPAGTYFLNVHKLGYLDVQQSADVMAGEAEPRIVKVILASDGKPAPFAVPYTFEGMIECGTSLVALCGGVHDGVQIACTNTPVCPPQPTNDAYSAFLAIDGVPDYLQTEMVWTSTQTLSTDMYYALRYADQVTYDNGMYEDGFDSFEGPSPLLGNVSGEDLADAEVGNRTGLVFSIFSGTGTYPVGVTVGQRYAFFIHAFYGYVPPSDWRFSEDGAPPPPA